MASKLLLTTRSTTKVLSIFVVTEEGEITRLAAWAAIVYEKKDSTSKVLLKEKNLSIFSNGEEEVVTIKKCNDKKCYYTYKYTR